jgi:hypothetical protein
MVKNVRSDPMPVFGPDFQTFEEVSNTRLRVIEAKEKAAVQLAHTLLEPIREPSSFQRIASNLGKLITERPSRPDHRRSVVAFYEPNDDASEAGLEPSMSAFFTDIYGGVLFTQPVRPGDGPAEKRLGVLQPRAIITEEGYAGNPVVALDEAGNPVYPDMMTLDDREDFINQVSETLSIISAQTYLDSTSGLRSA